MKNFRTDDWNVNKLRSNKLNSITYYSFASKMKSNISYLEPSYFENDQNTDELNYYEPNSLRITQITYVVVIAECLTASVPKFMKFSRRKSKWQTLTFQMLKIRYNHSVFLRMWATPKLEDGRLECMFVTISNGFRGRTRQTSFFGSVRLWGGDFRVPKIPIFGGKSDFFQEIEL